MTTRKFPPRARKAGGLPRELLGMAKVSFAVLRLPVYGQDYVSLYVFIDSGLWITLGKLWKKPPKWGQVAEYSGNLWAGLAEGMPIYGGYSGRDG